MISDTLSAHHDAIPKTVETANVAQFVMDLKDVGIVALALIFLVFVVGFFLKRFTREGKMDDALGSVADAKGVLYSNMSERIEKLERLLSDVSVENKALILTNASLNARVMLLEQHEAEVTKLKRLLDQKDDRISDMEIAMDGMRADKELMMGRITQLENQINNCKCNRE